jgi:hypothetical protein
MSSEQERKRQKKAQKHKEKRAEAKERRAVKVGSGKNVADWPLGEAWIGSNWPEQGARVHAALTRRHASGRVAAAIFDVDLKDRGVVDVKILKDVHPAELAQALSQRSTESTPLHVTEPALVAKLVREGAAHGELGGHPQPDVDEALGLFPDVNPKAATQAILVGDTPPPPPPKEGLWTSLKRRIGLGPKADAFADEV